MGELTFPLKNMVIKKDLIRKVLELVAKPLCDTFSPEAIRDVYGEALLVKGTDKSMLLRKELWISLLELLAISQLHSETPLSFDEIKNIHKKRKLLFVDTNEWTKKLEDIYRSDLSEIEKGGCVVIAATQDMAPSLSEIPKGFVPDISVIPEEMNISSTVKAPFVDLRVVHIYKFQFHIIQNAHLYAELTATNAKEFLKIKTDGLF